MASSEEQVLEEVKGEVSSAAKKLAQLGQEFERVAWLLEDALLLLDHPDEDRGFSVSSILEAELIEEEMEAERKLAANG